MEGSRWELACQKFPVANSSVVQREMSQLKPTPPSSPAGYFGARSLAGACMVVGVSWKAVRLSS